jgi:FkbM family methyltransferase
MAEHICPVWIGCLLANPLRKLLQNPQKILCPFLHPGMTVLDMGCAMGFFTIPMAKYVQPGGKVIAVDVQKTMIEKLHKRVQKHNLTSIIETRLCHEDSFNIVDLTQKVDFILLFAVLHETPDPAATLTALSRVLKQGGKLLLAEPKGHVSDPEFKASLILAETLDLSTESLLKITYSHAAILIKK